MKSNLLKLTHGQISTAASHWQFPHHGAVLTARCVARSDHRNAPWWAFLTKSRYQDSKPSSLCQDIGYHAADIRNSVGAPRKWCWKCLSEVDNQLTKDYPIREQENPWEGGKQEARFRAKTPPARESDPAGFMNRSDYTEKGQDLEAHDQTSLFLRKNLWSARKGQATKTSLSKRLVMIRPRLYTIYILQAGAMDAYKVGFCSDIANLPSRRATLQIGCPETLHFVGVICPVKGNGEQAAHEGMAEWRIRGEWYRLNPLMIDLLELDVNWANVVNDLCVPKKPSRKTMNSMAEGVLRYWNGSCNRPCGNERREPFPYPPKEAK